MINRTTQSLLGALGVLALALGVAEVHPPKGQAAASGASVRTAVRQTTLVCPPPMQGSGSTVYSLAAPGSSGSGANGSAGSSDTSGASAASAASLTPLSAPINGSATSSSGSSASPSASASASAKAAAPAAGSVAQLTQAGGGTTAKAASGSNAPAMLATASGDLAPGFTVQQTTVGKGVAGTSCTAPGTDFWFLGGDTNKGTTAYLTLSNAQQGNADADIQIYGPSGEIDNTSAMSINVPARGTSQLLLSSLVQPGNDGQIVAMHVLVRSGQLAAALHVNEDSGGSDWVPSSVPASSAVIPGLPGDVSKYSLAVAVPGDVDADLKIQLASQGGWITPAGHETVHVKSGMLNVVDLGDVTRGQPGTLRLTPTDPKQAVPFLATVQASGHSDVAYLTGTAPIERRGTVAGNASGATILLTAPNGAATVSVASVGSGGQPTTKTVQIAAGATVAVQPGAPSGASTFAVTITPTSGGPVYAARETGGHDGLTIQQIPDDGSTVLIPTVIQNPAILVQ